MFGHIRSLARSFAALAFIFALLAPHEAGAQTLSDKPIRILVPIAAGGATDLTARFVAQRLTESLKLNAYVENKPGGAFIPVLKELTSAAPDGHTLIVLSTANVVTQPMYPDYPYDLAKLTPVTEISNGPMVLVVPASARAWQEPHFCEKSCLPLFASPPVT